jgi:hypothetical protein
VTRPKRAVANLGRCPALYPAEALKSPERDVRGIRKKLVPIAASHVQICAYVGIPRRRAGVVAGLSGSVAAVFERETNALPTVQGVEVTCHPVAAAPVYVVTFTAGAQQVILIEHSCEGVTNGAMLARPTAHWLGELEFYSSTNPGGR